MKTILKITVLIIGLGLNSCSDFLDTVPEDFVSPINFYENKDQLNLALNGVYDPLGHSRLYGNNMAGRLGLDGDEAFFARSGQLDGPSVNNTSTVDRGVSGFWEQCYAGINRANITKGN